MAKNERICRNGLNKGQFRFRHCVVASTWAFEAQGPGSIPGGGAERSHPIKRVAEQSEATRSKGWRSKARPAAEVRGGER